MHLILDPAAQERLYDEVVAKVDKNARITKADVEAMHYLHVNTSSTSVARRSRRPGKPAASSIRVTACACIFPRVGIGFSKCAKRLRTGVGVPGDVFFFLSCQKNPRLEEYFGNSWRCSNKY
jgi:hypothetical protein